MTECEDCGARVRELVGIRGDVKLICYKCGLKKKIGTYGGKNAGIKYFKT